MNSAQALGLSVINITVYNYCVLGHILVPGARACKVQSQGVAKDKNEAMTPPSKLLLMKREGNNQEEAQRFGVASR